MNMATLGANLKGRSSYVGRCKQRGMDPGGKREVVESLVGCGSRLILFELCCLDDHTFRPFSAHLAHIENKVITIRIAPIGAEHRHEPAAARLVDFFYIMARGHLSQ